MNKIQKKYIFEYIIPILLLFLICMIPLFCHHEASAKGVLKVGVPISRPPFSFVDQDHEIIRGFSVDLVKLVAGDMRAGVEFYVMDDAHLMKALREKGIDLISGIMVNPDKTEGFNLIETEIKVDKKYFVHSDCITVTCYKDLPGHMLVLEKGRDLSNLVTLSENVNLLEANSHSQALSMVNSGQAQVYISECSLASLYLIQREGFQNIKEIGMPIETVPLSFAVADDDTELLTAVSLSLGKIMESKNYDLIYNKWLGRDIPYLHWSRYLKIILAAIGFVALLMLSFIFWNFTLRKKVGQITKNLQRSEQKYRDLIESSPDMIHLIDRDGFIKLANKIALDHLGFSEIEVTSQKIYDLVIAEDQSLVHEFIEEVFKKGFSNKEVTFESKSGGLIQVEMVGTTMSGSDDLTSMACCFSRDLSERKRLEEDLIHSDRLAIMGRMAAGLAHEINNPLGIILTHAQDVLHHETNTESAHESLKVIERNAIRAGEIIENLLSFTRPQPAEFTPIDLVQLIDESLFFLKQRVKQKKIKIEKSYPGYPVMLSCDENLIQQLLINLFLNALQAIKEEGEIKVRVNTENGDSAEKIIMEIEDSGKGIIEKDMQKIFDPFFTSRKENGFGMGLFISRIIVEKHHGIITARSRVGEGTTLRVEFPAGF